LLEEEVIDQLQGPVLTWLGDRYEIIAQPEGQLVERQKVDIEEGSRLVMSEGLFQLLDERSRGNNDSERSKGIVALTTSNIFDQRRLKDWMERPGDDAKHQEP